VGDALLVYGYDIGDGDDLGMGQDTDVTGQLMSRLRHASGFTETYEDGNLGYFSREREADLALGVEVISHGSASYPMYLLVAFEMTASHGYPETVDLAGLRRRVVDEDWDGRLASACQVLGVTPAQPQPTWILASDQG
jgi:hypothetical protein